MNKLLLVDGNSLINRAYYATTLTNGATYGFLNMFLKEITDTNCTHVAVAFDVRAKTFRHEMYDGYKANRKGMPDELAAQLFDLKEILAIMGITTLEKAGFEADDIIGTIADRAGQNGFHTAVLTADRDLLQLLSASTEVILTKTGVSHTEVYTPDRFLSEYGVVPEQLVDIKALMGDPSDNIPGAKGIGEKTAVKLVKQFASAEALLEQFTADPTVAKLTAEDVEMIKLSKRLAQINRDVEIPCDFAALEFAFPMGQPVYAAFKERKFFSLINKPNLFTNTGVPTQQSFF